MHACTFTHTHTHAHKHMHTHARTHTRMWNDWGTCEDGVNADVFFTRLHLFFTNWAKEMEVFDGRVKMSWPYPMIRQRKWTCLMDVLKCHYHALWWSKTVSDLVKEQLHKMCQLLFKNGHWCWHHWLKNTGQILIMDTDWETNGQWQTL